MTRPLPPITSALDPGVHNFVLFLRAHGFRTSDSGDGVTKLRAGEPDDGSVLPWAHVFITTHADELVAEADRLLDVMRTAEIAVEPCNIEATYDPTQKHPDLGRVGVIAIMDREDRYIRGFTSARPLPPLEAAFGWGHLKDHWQTCDECGGTGLVVDDVDGDERAEACDGCDGEGRLRWGSYYVQDRGECDVCKGDNVPIAAMFEGDERPELYVCLRCYLATHHDACGCALWEDAEAKAKELAR